MKQMNIRAKHEPKVENVEFCWAIILNKYICTATKEPVNVSENGIQNYERATNAYVQ